MKQEATLWETTKTPGLYVRRPGETFYARITLNSKRSWRSLKPEKVKEAEKHLRDLQNGHTRQVSTRTADELHAALSATIGLRQPRPTNPASPFSSASRPWRRKCR